MEYVKLQGAKLPVLGLGTAGIKGNDGLKAIKHALKIGYRHIDTAQSYANEGIVGKALEESEIDREEIFITTKVRTRYLDPEDLIPSVGESLARLRTDYVDLLLIHWPNEEVPVEETVNAMNQLQKQGLVKHIGVSNFTVDLMEQAREASSTPILCNQVEYHPFLSQEEILQYVQKHGLLLTSYSPLARGNIANNETLQEIGEQYGKTPAQITLRWHIQQDNVIAIPKASKKTHQKENFQVFDFQLTTEDMEKISNLERGKRYIDPDSAPWN